jgi:hypothetical protein
MKAVSFAFLATVLAALVPSAVSASDGDIRNAGECTGSSSSKIKVKPDDGRIEVEFEVDQNVNGQKWKVKLKNGSDVVFKGVATTKAPSGSFSIERKITDRAGADQIKAVARSKSSGEQCSAAASI